MRFLAHDCVHIEECAAAHDGGPPPPPPPIDYFACSIPSDCELTSTTCCCECGADTSPHNLIALRVSEVDDYLAAVCDPAEGCDACIPTYPAEAEARCVSGLCRVIIGDP